MTASDITDRPKSNEMYLLEFVVHRNLKPNASTEQTVDLPQITTCPPVSEPDGLISRGNTKASASNGATPILPVISNNSLIAARHACSRAE